MASSSSSSSSYESLVIVSVDVCKNEIKFDITPPTAASRPFKVIVKGPTDIIMIDQFKGGGKNQTVGFDWSKFPQTAGEEFAATKIQIKWGNISKEIDVNFTGYGVFRISKYVTPDDDQWTGGTTNVAFQADGSGATRSVHSSWISRVRGSEGIGQSQGSIYNIRSTSSGAPVANYLTETEEGAYVDRLTVDKSLAKHQSETRFAAHDKIVLSTDLGHCFSIDDTGNWSGGNNHLDRFGGLATPSTPDVDYPDAYVVKVQ